jgi:hypothetical protein
MPKNMGNTDRWIRIIIGIIFVLWAIFVATGVWAGALYAIGAILIITSLVGTCPLYMPFGISTKKK